MDILAIAGIIIGVIIVLIKTIPDRIYLKTLAQDTIFVCPHCGAQFKVPWYKLIFEKNRVYIWKQAKLKCPSCGIKDGCGVYDRD